MKKNDLFGSGKVVDSFFVMLHNAGEMKLDSDGILIGLRPFNERDCVARIFTREHGVMTGMLRGAVVAKKNKPLLGQVGVASWNARLDSQLGEFHCAGKCSSMPGTQDNVICSLRVDGMQALLMNFVFDDICDASAYGPVPVQAQEPK